MNANEITIESLGLSANALDTIAAVGLDNETVQRDVARLRSGEMSIDQLCAACLEGADGDDVIGGWREYVNAVAAAAAGGNAIDRAIEHATLAGADDYRVRAADVASGRESPEWAWPPSGADEAYLNAIAASQICREAGISIDEWDGVRDAWAAAFMAAYKAARADDEVA